MNMPERMKQWAEIDLSEANRDQILAVLDFNEVWRQFTDARLCEGCLPLPGFEPIIISHLNYLASSDKKHYVEAMLVAHADEPTRPVAFLIRDVYPEPKQIDVKLMLLKNDDANPFKAIDRQQLEAGINVIPPLFTISREYQKQHQA